MSNSKKNGSGSSASRDAAVSGQQRLRPERARRGRVEKVWRSVRWAEAYPDECLTMNAVDLTPTFALRKLAVLFDSGKVGECAALVRRLNAITLESILGQLPVDLLHDALPSSLPVLEAIYVKVAQGSSGRLPTDRLRTDQLVQRLVALFARHSPQHPGTAASPRGGPGGGGGEEKNCNLHVPCCRSILRVIMDAEPNFRRTVAQRKRALDRCLRRMGQHGLVSGADGKLLSLHEALKVELERQVAQLKGTLHKLEQLNLTSGKHGGPERQVSGRPAPSEASHQRLLQVSRGEVQERVIKNKTLLTSAEPAAQNLTLQRLLRTLRARVEADKLLLFHDTELRKMAAHTSRARLAAMAESSSPSAEAKSGSPSQVVQHKQMAMTLRQFSQGYSVLLRLAREVAEAQGEINSQDAEEEEEESEDSGEEGLRGMGKEGDYLSVTSTLSIMKKMKVISLNGVFPGHAAGLAASSGRLGNGWLGLQQTTAGSRGQRKREAGTQTTPMMEHGDMSKDVATAHQPTYPPEKGGGGGGGTQLLNNTVATPGGGSVAMLEQEVLYLRQELSTAREQIRKLQEQEKELRERLVGQVHQQFRMGNDHFEDIALGTQRPTELIRRYGDLYLDGRVDALDALDRLDPLRDLDVLKMKILFSVIVLAFKATQQNVGELRGRLQHLLGLPVPSLESQQHQQNSQQPGGESAFVAERHSPCSAAAEVEHHITTYLCKTSDTFETAEIVFEVCQQIYATLYDYPCLKACSGLLEYVSQCVRVAWGLCVQRLPYTISYESQTFNDGVHTRFHTSDADSEQIKSYLWPALVDAQGGCVSRAVVIT